MPSKVKIDGKRNKTRTGNNNKLVLAFSAAQQSPYLCLGNSPSLGSWRVAQATQATDIAVITPEYVRELLFLSSLKQEPKVTQILPTHSTLEPLSLPAAQESQWCGLSPCLVCYTTGYGTQGGGSKESLDQPYGAGELCLDLSPYIKFSTPGLLRSLCEK